MQKNKEIYFSHSDKNQEFANNILKTMNGNVIALIGDLGYGKTALVKDIARTLGIKKSITSPTFVLLKEYEIKNKKYSFKKLIHIDCYRMIDYHDALGIGIIEYIEDKNNLVVIEWADRIKPLLGRNILNLNFTYIDKNKRKINLSQG